MTLSILKIKLKFYITVWNQHDPKGLQARYGKWFGNYTSIYNEIKA